MNHKLEIKIYDNVLKLIGKTPIVRLNNLVTGQDAEVLVKLEYYNPTGSLKDRIGLYMIEQAEREGILKPGDIVIEPTTGNTGTSLALVCAIKGYRMIAVMPEGMSKERQDMMRAFGARILLIPSHSKEEGVSREDMETTVAKAHELAAQSGYFMLNQFANPANVTAHYETTAQEIWEQTEGELDAFVMGVGTSGTAMGVSRSLKEHNPEILVYVVEPLNSSVISGFEPKSHCIQGIGEGFIPDLLDRSLFDGVIRVSDEDSKWTACQLSRWEGIFSGYSTGANVSAALKVARDLGPGKRVVTIAADTGMKYLTTELYQYDMNFCAVHCCDIRQCPPICRANCTNPSECLVLFT